MNEFSIHKRRVRTTIHLADQTCLNGHLYSDLHNHDCSPSNVLNRLNNHAETFLPLALENEHCLLRKSRIVSATVENKELEAPRIEGVTEFNLRVTLSNRSVREGRTFAHLPPAHSRALDHLNSVSQRFIPLWNDRQVFLINVQHIVSVIEPVVSDT